MTNEFDVGKLWANELLAKIRKQKRPHPNYHTGLSAFTNTINIQLVPKVGVEPTLLAEHDFESCASASSATPAQKKRFHKLVSLIHRLATRLFVQYGRLSTVKTVRIRSCAMIIA